MKKYDQRKDPTGIEGWTRQYLGIPADVSTSDYLVNNEYAGRTPAAMIKKARLSLAWLEPRIDTDTQHLFIELKSIIDAYENAFKATALSEADEVRMEKALLLWKNIELIQHTVPALQEQKGYKKTQSERASKPRKLSEAQHARIASQYAEGKKNGEGYGLAKSLAARYNVSATTIHTIVKKSENNRKKIK